jgi:Ca-activated chloride channel family protein
MSRLTVLALALLALPQMLLAQGRLVSTACVSPGGEACRLGDCAARPPQCGPGLVRTSSDVKVGMADRVLRYEVTETFVNRSGRIAEADYVFPLPAGAAFEDLKLSINGELVSGETMSADKARGIYEEIVRKLRDPALVEWMGQGLLRTRIFPIQPGEEKKVVVRFQAVATREGDALRIDYRRGTDPNTSLPQPRPVREDRPRGTEQDSWTSFSLYYKSEGAYGEPYSPTHTLRTRSEGNTRLVEARGSAPEVTILLPLRNANTAAMSVLTHAPGDTRGFALITITPPSAPRRTLPRDVTFVVDVSGSMRGIKLEQAKKAGHALLESLGERDRFRVIDFSTDIRSFEDGWVDATRHNVRNALRYIDALRADGSTNISGALEAALRSRPDEERLPLLVFITDGEPTVGERDPGRIAALASRLRGETRIFSIGVSAEVNAALIEQLAVQGRGTAHYVRNDESVERTVSLLASRLTSPVLTNVRLRADGVRLSQVMPSGPIDVFAGQDLVVLARYEGSGGATIRLEGDAADGPLTWSTRARFAGHDRGNAFVARLWAAQRIGWLAAEKRVNGGNAEIDQEIRTLGERYGIPTEFSSYLVVEPGMDVSRRRDVAAQSMGQGRTALDQVVVTGAGSAVSAKGGTRGTMPPATAPTANEQRFEAARSAAVQRDAKSMAELESDVGVGTRTVGTRLFRLEGGVWKDAALTAAHRTVRVKPFSALYFDLMKRVEQLGPVFALGERVIVAGKGVAIELAPDGLERLGEQELNTLVRDW